VSTTARAVSRSIPGMPACFDRSTGCRPPMRRGRSTTGDDCGARAAPALRLSLMNRWASDGGNPFADAKWDEAWKVSAVDRAACRRSRRPARRNPPVAGCAELASRRHGHRAHGNDREYRAPRLPSGRDPADRQEHARAERGDVLVLAPQAAIALNQCRLKNCTARSCFSAAAGKKRSRDSGAGPSWGPSFASRGGICLTQAADHGYWKRTSTTRSAFVCPCTRVASNLSARDRQPGSLRRAPRGRVIAGRAG